MVKYQIEFIMKCSTKVLFSRLATASGLTEWFADDVTVQGKKFTFTWGGSTQIAFLINKQANESVRFHWEDEDEETFFEFVIQKQEVTRGIALEITDFAEDDEVEESKQLWSKQVETLQQVLGI